MCRTSTNENTWFCNHLAASPAETERESENPLKNSLFCWALTKSYSGPFLLLIPLKNLWSYFEPPASRWRRQTNQSQVGPG